jgi:hypothetical protein
MLPYVIFALKDCKVMERSHCHYWLMSEPHKRDEKHWLTHSEAFKIDYSTYAQEHSFFLNQSTST